MATGAILTRKKIISQHVYSSVRSIQSFQGLGHGYSSSAYSSLGYYHHNTKERDKDLVTNGGLLPHPPKQSTTGPRPYELTVIGVDKVRSKMFLTMGMRFRSLSIHSASATTAEKPKDDEEKETMAAKRRKEASPEECDQAVEGLSCVKAKAKAKQLTDSKKVAKSILQRARTVIVGSDPALRAIASMSREDWSNKLVHWKHEIKSTLQHYWLGLKLLAIDVRISSRLLQKLASSKSLSRRERQQLIPFTVFIIVPLMEFLRPVFLKLFPNRMKEQEVLKRKLNAQYAKFLQDTVKEMAKEVQNSRGGETKKTAEDLDEFLNRVRRGNGVSNDEILGFAKLFNDELTLDNISRPWLVNMSKYKGIGPYGTDAYLHLMLWKRLQRIKDDDGLIQSEGLECLPEAELHEDCGQRGMLELHSVEDMRLQIDALRRALKASSALFGTSISIRISSNAYRKFSTDTFLEEIKVGSDEIFEIGREALEVKTGVPKVMEIGQEALEVKTGVKTCVPKVMEIGQEALEVKTGVKTCVPKIQPSQYKEIALQSISGAAMCGGVTLLNQYRHEPFHMFLHGLRSYDSNWKIMVHKGLSKLDQEYKETALNNLEAVLREEDVESFLKNWMTNVLVGTVDLEYWLRSITKHGSELKSYVLFLDRVNYLPYFTLLQDFIEPRQDELLNLEVDLIENGPHTVAVVQDKFRAIFGVAPVLYITRALIEKENGKLENEFLFTQAGFFLHKQLGFMDANDCKWQLKAPLGSGCTEATLLYFSRKRNPVLRRVLLY